MSKRLSRWVCLLVLLAVVGCDSDGSIARAQKKIGTFEDQVKEMKRIQSKSTPELLEPVGKSPTSEVAPVAGGEDRPAQE